MLILAVYTTVVVGCVMGLVLFINHERQKEHRYQLETQMEDFSNRLSELSTRLIGQLEEKANLTASEFEIRTLLQNEKDHHKRTRNQLATQIDHNNSLQNKMESERKERLRYQSDTDRKLEERFRQEDLRYQNLADTQKRSLANVQAQFDPPQQRTDPTARANRNLAAQSAGNHGQNRRHPRDPNALSPKTRRARPQPEHPVQRLEPNYGPS